MATMFGRFEIQSEISNSETALIYKAIDTETNQTVALKTQSLEPLGERAAAFVDRLIMEGERTRDLGSQNIAVLYGAGEIDGQFCAAMEYVQGNSIATMLARKEGFSIWDLLDITRQVCAGLDYAAKKEVVHYSLEPAKIMVQWDGLAKILGYGISSMSLIEAESGHGLGRLMPYCSPEQVRGEALDLRSNLFTWGAILYEMVAGRKAFDANDPAQLMAQIQQEMPPDPLSLNRRMQPGVAALIMKALAKDPEARYQTARELVEDIEKSKDTGKKTTLDPKKPTARGVSVDPAARAAAASKFVSFARDPAPPAANSSSNSPEPELQTFSEPPRQAPQPKFSAAAAGAGGTGRFSGSGSGARGMPGPAPLLPNGQTTVTPVMSTAAAEPSTETNAPHFAVDPMMAGAGQAPAGKTFSDLDELPPLKEVSFTPAPPPLPEPDEPVVLQRYPKQEDKPKIHPREVAQKAIREVKTVPPQLMLYAILGAMALILIVSVWLFFHVRSEDDGSTAAPRPTRTAATEKPFPPAASAKPLLPAPDEAAPQPAPAPEFVAEPEPEVIVRPLDRRTPKNAKRVATRAPAAVIPGQIQVDSNPPGAQIQVDGRSDPSWVTPFNLTGFAPGKHLVSASKTGYTAETRSVDVSSGSKSFVVLQLSPTNALLVVGSTPAGADIVIDGRITGRVTPAQFAVEKGSHTVVLRKQGYLEEATTADLGPGQNFRFAPALRALGNADEIRTVGKFKKLFRSGGDNVAGMGSVSIRTQPKGAQIALNQHLLEKVSPVEIMVGPGAYVLDLTLTGFKPVHKVITIEKGSKVAVDEILERQ